MTTAISIVLYGLAVVFGITTGAASERKDKAPAGYGGLIVLALFVAGAALQVWG